MKSTLTIIKVGIAAALVAVSTLALAAVTPPTGANGVTFGTPITSFTSVTLTEDVIPGNKSRVSYYKSSGAITCLSWTMTQTVAGGGRLIFKSDLTPAKTRLYEGVRGQFQASKTASIQAAGALNIGKGYTIRTTGTTNWMAEQGASSNAPGTRFVATAHGTGGAGVGTATYTEYDSNVIVAEAAYGVAPTVHAPIEGTRTTASDKWSFVSGTSEGTIEVVLTYDPRSQTGTCSIRKYLP